MRGKKRVHLRIEDLCGRIVEQCSEAVSGQAACSPGKDLDVESKLTMGQAGV